MQSNPSPTAAVALASVAAVALWMAWAPPAVGQPPATQPSEPAFRTDARLTINASAEAFGALLAAAGDLPLPMGLSPGDLPTQGRVRWTIEPLTADIASSPQTFTWFGGPAHQRRRLAQAAWTATAGGRWQRQTLALDDGELRTASESTQAAIDEAIPIMPIEWGSSGRPSRSVAVAERGEAVVIVNRLRLLPSETPTPSTTTDSTLELTLPTIGRMGQSLPTDGLQLFRALAVMPPSTLHARWTTVDGRLGWRIELVDEDAFPTWLKRYKADEPRLPRVTLEADTIVRLALPSPSTANELNGQLRDEPTFSPRVLDFLLTGFVGEPVTVPGDVLPFVGRWALLVQRNQHYALAMPLVEGESRRRANLALRSLLTRMADRPNVDSEVDRGEDERFHFRFTLRARDGSSVVVHAVLGEAAIVVATDADLAEACTAAIVAAADDPASRGTLLDVVGERSLRVRLHDGRLWLWLPAANEAATSSEPGTSADD